MTEPIARKTSTLAKPSAEQLEKRKQLREAYLAKKDKPALKQPDRESVQPAKEAAVEGESSSRQTISRRESSRASDYQNLLTRVAELESKFQRQTAMISALTRRGIIIAKEDGSPEAWKQQAINDSAELEELTDGLTASASDDEKALDLSTMTGGAGAFFLLPVKATKDGEIITRYIKIMAGGLFAAHLVQDGGSAGDASTPCTFTYTVNSLDDATTFATGVTPLMQRPAFGRQAKANYGIALVNGEDTLIIYCDEVDGVHVCPATEEEEEE